MSRQVYPHREFSSEDIIQIAEECIKAREQNPDASWLVFPKLKDYCDSEDILITDKSGTYVLTHQLYPYVCTPWLDNNDPMGSMLGLLSKQTHGDDTLAGKLTRANNRALTLINDEFRRLYPNSPGFIKFESGTVEHSIGRSCKVYHMQVGSITPVPLADLKEWLYPGSLVAPKNHYRVFGLGSRPGQIFRSVIFQMMVRRAKTHPMQDYMKEEFEHFEQQSNLE